MCNVNPVLLTVILSLLAVVPPVTSSKPDAITALLNRLDSQRSSPPVQESAAREVLNRLLPTHFHSFQFNIISKDVCNGQSCFVINNYNSSRQNGPEIIIKGTTAVEIASGLHWYIKYWCGAHVSWDKTGGIQISTVPKPGSLPHVKAEGVMIQRPVPWNYYQNVVTSSYSYVWWDWERWEKEIDWMALQGINLPLAFTGQEAIWQRVFADFNISMEDLNDFFGGPAFLAWARMGNLHGWGGPLSQNWLDQQLVLQKQILSRMLELGMTPVLPSFSGNVPAALKKIFPSADITRLGDWNTVDGDPRWCCTYLLNPSDTLFVEIGEAFIRQQIKEYGDVTDIYNCDTFNENSPPTNDTAYITSLGAGVYKAMSRGDKHAVWLMQGWLFYSDSAFWKQPQMKALLHSVPFGKMIVLDLFADVTPIWKTSSQFYGTPYIWCMLHNFGGNIEMYGILDAISSGPVEARGSQNSTMFGVGMCMEGIEHNPVVYELMSEMAFRNEKVQVLEWLKTYALRRYGKAVHQIETAWEILYRTVYNCTDRVADHNTDFIVKLPDWNPSSISGSDVSNQIKKHMLLTLPGTRRYFFQETSSDLPKAHLWYSTQEVIKALRLFLDVGNDLSGSLTYRYDLVDLTRQVLSKLANQVYLDAVVAFGEKDVKSLTYNTQKFVQLIKDIDVLLASDDNFLLGTWLESAKKLAVNPREMRQYEWNARTQITMWYDTTKTNQSMLHDYANKFWSGLLEGYYLPRASIYFSYLSNRLRKNEKFKFEEWMQEWISFSNKWQEGTELYPVKAKGDALAISKSMYEKYFG
ncbi:NAGLU domain-containing protein/NAGLU_N domain-containing protein/NAGLU_C domain-containing protein [Cephalotus follicularis]|uniref:Alpha-N-acetylglucosaminidase n=1 Tax=Cephalotus follicularis TaxID=3775 RepID=A0A1Q3D7N6_CEPFO|nr:NAGLU domain-containing protein/NAGLU_N domain-containing protein/NAGLU_C domain-containing protein [Cephalotus follicularis]